MAVELRTLIFVACSGAKFCSCFRCNGANGTRGNAGHTPRPQSVRSVISFRCAAASAGCGDGDRHEARAQKEQENGECKIQVGVVSK